MTEPGTLVNTMKTHLSEPAAPGEHHHTYISVPHMQCNADNADTICISEPRTLEHTKKHMYLCQDTLTPFEHTHSKSFENRVFTTTQLSTPELCAITSLCRPCTSTRRTHFYISVGGRNHILQLGYVMGDSSSSGSG